MKLLLLSNSTDYGRSPLEHAHSALRDALGHHRTVTFIPFAQRNVDKYTSEIAAALRPLDISVVGAQTFADIRAAVNESEVIYVGGGNTFRLLKALQDLRLMETISKRVVAGIPYIGDSAGSIIAGPTIQTTNDMPVVEPAGFRALGLVPFQINPHYIAGAAVPQFMGETRDERIDDFLDEVDVPVLALREGSWLRVDGDEASLGGTGGASVFQRNREVRTVEPSSDLSWLFPC